MVASHRSGCPKSAFLLHTCAQTLRSRVQRGVTLLELLVSLAIASIFLGATATIVARSMSSTEAEVAKSLTQSEMNQVISFLQREMDQAVFVYQEDQLNEALAAAPASWGPDPDRIPVLGFWRVQRLSEACIQAAYISSPSDAEEIARNQILAVGAMYELVVYYWEENDTGIWVGQGPARITRRSYRPITGEGRVDCTFQGDILTTYSNPQPETSADFVNWPANTSVPAPTEAYFELGQAIVPFVDDNDPSTPPADDPITCPEDYVPAYTPNPIPAFYACVLDQIGSTNATSVYIRVRGNASTDRARGNFDPNVSAFFPVVETRAFPRGSFGIN